MMPDTDTQSASVIEPVARTGPQYTNDQLDQLAIQIVKTEKQRWELATAFVTDRVSFKMRQLIRILRKNYYGIFDQPIDPFTQTEKIWYPLTEINVEAVLKNIDIDQKDIMFKARGPSGYGMTDLTRSHIKDKLTDIQFGQKVSDFERYLSIDGTAVWKTYKEFGKCQVVYVDLLNIYIDPTSPSIAKSYRFTERALMFKDEMIGMNGWRNLHDLHMVEGLPRVDPFWMNRATQVNSNVKMKDVYECWGKIPKSLITGDVADEREEVDGHIVVSGIDGGEERCHLIEMNLKKDREGNAVKPYEEAWYTRVPNRWYGRGIAEKLLTLQIYANIVFNVRINRSRISQLGLFKVRKGSGITPQMLARLPSNGVVTLTTMDDLQQLEVQEVGQSSYNDEGVINTLSERLTSAFEVVTGENLPSDTPATNAAISNNNAKSGFTIVKDRMADFLKRWMDRHALPIFAEELNVGEVVRIEQDEDNFKDLVDRIVHTRALKSLDKSYADGYLPSKQEMAKAIDNARQKMLNSHLFIKMLQKLMASELDTDVVIGNEEIDIPLTIQNLINVLNIAPEYKDAIVKQTFDLLGLPMPQKDPAPAQPQQGAPGVAQGNPGLPPAQAALAAGVAPPQTQSIRAMALKANAPRR